MRPQIAFAHQTLPNFTQVVVLDNNGKLPSNLHTDIVEIINPLLKEFNDSDTELEFVKNGKTWIFIVKSNENSEKNRMFGYQIRKKITVDVTDVTILSNEEKDALELAEGLALANYQFLKYKEDRDKKTYKLAHIFIDAQAKQFEIDYLNNTIEAVYWSRDLVNEPHSYLTATQLSKEIQTKLTPLGVSVNILEKNQIEALKLGGLIAVNLGSEEPPTFTIIEYKPLQVNNKKPLILVGKGVVYDTGGLSLKPTAHSMDLMKSDMAGAAAMVGAMLSLSLNQIPVHVICIIPATDNRPGRNAYVPGDIIKMYNGKTVEVLNTDAEGRMILADALSYADKYQPELVIDAATLTGSAVRAIGTKASIVMGNAPQSTIDALIDAGNKVHERLVQLPFWDEYGEVMKSEIADLNNLGGPNAGMITAGKFLENFTTSPYIHLDIAGPAFLEAEDGYRGKGGTGVGVRLITNFLAQYKNGK